MKIKRIVAFLTAAALCLCLCGCRVDVDELRARHGVWDENGNIVLNGAVYRPLEAYGTLDPALDYDYESLIYVTEDDVPLLLAETNGEECNISFDGVFLHRLTSTADTYYCREDRYDEVRRQIQNLPPIDTFRYSYNDKKGDTQNVIMTTAQAAILQEILDTMTWEPGDAYEQPLLEEDFKRLAIRRCSANGWFTGGENIYVYWVPGNAEYLLETEAMYAYYTTYISYVPATRLKEFESLFATALENDDTPLF